MTGGVRSAPLCPRAAERIPSKLPLDEVLASLSSVRFMKVDIKGSEFPVRTTSRLLPRVFEIAGEYHANDDYRVEAEAMEYLAQDLYEKGFWVIWRPSPSEGSQAARGDQDVSLTAGSVAEPDNRLVRRGGRGFASPSRTGEGFGHLPSGAADTVPGASPGALHWGRRHPFVALECGHVAALVAAFPDPRPALLMDLLCALLFLMVLFELAARLGWWLAPEQPLSPRWSQGLAASTLAFSMAALLLSIPGWLTPLAIQVVTALCLPWLIRSQAWTDLKSLGQPRAGLLLGLALFFGLLATVPNTHWDSQVYHYTLPRLYLERGRVYWTGTGIYDSLFSLSHLLYAWAMGCAGETGVNLLGFVFLGLLTTSLMAVVHEASEGGPGQNVVLALVASSPLLLAQADGGLTDPPAAAYVAAMMAGTPSRGSWIWGLAAILTRLNAGVAVGLWILATGRRRVVAFVVLAGLLPWVAFNLLNHHVPWYPFGTLWRVQDFRGALWSDGAHRLLLPGWQPGADGRAWASLLSPLLLPGLILLRQAWPRPTVVFGLLGVAASSALLLQQPRYQLPWLLGLVVWSALGWAQQLPGKRGLTRCFAALAGLSALVAVSPWWPKLCVAVGQVPVSTYLRSRITPWNAYRWLKGTSYSRVMLTDPRAYHCPKPFFLVDQGFLVDSSYPGVIAYLTDQKCDAVLWNFENPKVAQAALWQASMLARGDRQILSQGLIGRLGPAWLEEQFRKWPELQRPETAPPDHDPIHHKLRVLYLLCVHAQPVFQDGQVLVTEWPVPGKNRPRQN